MRFRSACVLAAVLIPALAGAAELKPETAQAYDRHITAVRDRFVAAEAGPFWIEQQPATVRARLRAGEVIAWPGEGDGIVHVPDGLIHDWRAATFVPGASLDKVLATTEDYAHYSRIYGWVVRSGLLSHQRENGDDRFRVFLRLKESAHFVTGVLDLWTVVDYRQPRPDRTVSISHSDCIRQVENAGEPNEHRLPEGTGSGFLWRADTFATYLARDGGVYAEFETIGLSRTIPRLLGWIVEPIARRLGRGSAAESLTHLRDVITGVRRPTAAAGSTGPIPTFWCHES